MGKMRVTNGVGCTTCEKFVQLTGFVFLFEIFIVQVLNLETDSAAATRDLRRITDLVVFVFARMRVEPAHDDRMIWM